MYNICRTITFAFYSKLQYFLLWLWNYKDFNNHWQIIKKNKYTKNLY